MSNRGWSYPIFALFLSAFVASCSKSGSEIDGYDELVRHVSSNPIGQDDDFWIEYKNMAGDWEKTGLIFGYLGDFEEFEKATAGLKAANPKSEYRCIPANQKLH